MGVLEAAEIVGTISFAMSGFFVASNRGLDLLGLFIAAFLTALGGGVIRDLLVHREIYAFHHDLPSLLVIGVVVSAILLKLHRYAKVERSLIFVIADTLGLVSFAISGALVALSADFNFSGVMLLSLITAVGGGVLRDMLINEVPMILASEFYGSVALLLGTGVYLLHLSGGIGFLSLTLLFAAGVVLRLVAYLRNWHLPKII